MTPSKIFTFVFIAVLAMGVVKAITTTDPIVTDKVEAVATNYFGVPHSEIDQEDDQSQAEQRAERLLAAGIE